MCTYFYRLISLIQDLIIYMSYTVVARAHLAYEAGQCHDYISVLANFRCALDRARRCSW